MAKKLRFIEKIMSCDFYKKLTFFFEKIAPQWKKSARAQLLGDKVDFFFLLLCFEAIGEGRGRACGHHQPL
jgi:hypothetical protein